MYPTFKFKTLAIAITSLTVTSLAGAAGLDRSGQDVTAFFQDGTYVEAVYSYIDADVTGHDNNILGIDDLSKYDKGNKIDDIAESYDFFRYGLKTDINDTFSIGILYDEPFGAAAKYTGHSNFISGGGDATLQRLTNNQGITLATAPTAIAQIINGAQQAGAAAQQAQEAAKQAQQAGNTQQAQQLTQQAQDLGAKATQLQAQAKGLISATAIAGGAEASKGEGTNVEVRTENLTGLVGMKIGDNFQIYGGPAIQRLRADVKLGGPAYLTSAGYTAHISSNDGYGWVGGVAFTKPEIALRAALTYRSEIEHEDTNIGEVLPSVDYLPSNYQDKIANFAADNGVGSMDITTPESFNFDFQTGINPTTLATAKVRYVPWEDFSIVPPLYNAASKINYPDGLPLVDYSDDQWQVELGLAKRLNPSLAVSGTVGWDSGAGNPVSSLGPIEGYYSVGAGAKFNLNENWAISAGAKYLMFGDADGALPNHKIASKFDDNDGYVAGIKLSYQEK